MVTAARVQSVSGRIAVVAVMVVVAAVLLSVGPVKLNQGHHPDTPPAARLADSVSTPDASWPLPGNIDRGPVTETDGAAIGRCLAPDFATSPAEVSVLYGVRQRTRDGEVPVLVLRNRADYLRLCDAAGGDYPAERPYQQIGPDNPVGFLSNGRRDWTCGPAKLRRFEATEWLVTSDAVAAVRMRFVVDGRPGRWFATRPVDGYAHLAGWLDGPLPRETPIVLEQQVLDATGAPLTQSVVPDRQELAGCPAGSGGSVQIG